MEDTALSDPLKMEGTARVWLFCETDFSAQIFPLNNSCSEISVRTRISVLEYLKEGDTEDGGGS